MNMAGMNQIGGPVGCGQPTNGIQGGRRNTPEEPAHQDRFHGYIYEYFIKEKHWDVARSMLQAGLVSGHSQKASPGGRPLNGVNDLSDDVKEEKKPDDLPEPPIQQQTPGAEYSFLWEWWCVFWDMYKARRGQAQNSPSAQLLGHQRVSLSSPCWLPSC